MLYYSLFFQNQKVSIYLLLLFQKMTFTLMINFLQNTLIHFLFMFSYFSICNIT
jgi:hypothetical protein